MSTAVVLKSLIQESKDGEWGKGEPFEDSVKMAVIRGTDFEAIRNGNIDALPIRYIPKRIADRKTLQQYDIVLETAGGSKDRPTGRSLFIKSSIIHRSELPLTCASFSRFIRIDPTKADPRYVFWHLQYLYDADYLRQYHTQHTGVARFQYTVFSEREELLIPPLPIQHKIAAILSAYDDLIENNTRRIEILEEMARSLYREWFLNFRFPGYEQVKMVDSERGVIPEGWEIVSIGKIAKVKGGKRLPKGKLVQDEKTNYPYIRVKDMKDFSLDTSDIKYIDEEAYKAVRHYTISSQDVYISIAGTIGRTGIVPKFLSGANLTENAANICEIESINKYLLFFYLCTPEGQAQIASKVVGTSQPKLALFRIKEIKILLPPSNLQIKAALILSSYSEQIENLTSKNTNLHKTRDLLLPKLISGEINLENLENLDIETEGLIQWVA